MKEIICAYCGTVVTKPDREHVFPTCLYPPSKMKSKVQRLTVPACNKCNNSWADDEAYFRNVLVLAGENPNPVRQELWETTILRSFKEIDGFRRKHEIIENLKPITLNNEENYMVYLGKDERVMRIVRKIIRGLSYNHKIIYPVSDEQVWADILKYTVSQELLDQLEHHHREQDIVEYRYQVMNEPGYSSAWYITFFKKVTFIGLVSAKISDLT